MLRRDPSERGVVDSQLVDELRLQARRTFGLDLSRERELDLWRVLERCTPSSSSPAETIERVRAGDELISNALVDELTVGETYFFREQEQLTALVDVVVPEHRRRAGAAPLRVLSAGCASGEEPYTIAMTLHAVGQPAVVDAVDASADRLDRARRGRYGAWSLRQTDTRTRERYFRHDGDEFVVTPEIAGSVRFEQHLLNSGTVGGWERHTYDAIFCRNVLMYLTTEALDLVARRLVDRLADQGTMFVGHAEHLRSLADVVESHAVNGVFCYRRRPARPGGGSGAGRAHRGAAPLALVRTAAPSEPEADGTTWHDTIEQSSRRLRRIVESASGPQTRPSATARVGRDATTNVDVDALLRQAATALAEERPAAARELVAAVRASVGDEPRCDAIDAAAFLQEGEPSTAARLAQRLFATDELAPEAHLLSSLANAALGDPAAAAAHDLAAIDLDPRFAMAHLHVGMLRRVQRPGDARRSLDRAAMLFRFESEFRLALFGGGFPRAAWIECCETALAREDADR